MEISLDDLKAMLNRASVYSSHGPLNEHELDASVVPLDNSIDINVYDYTTHESILTISIPATIKTTFSF